MARFYASVALSALFCRAFQIKFDWGKLDGRVTGNATLSSELTGSRLKANFGLLTLAAAAILLAALTGGALVPNAVPLAEYAK